ncbi:germ cell-specific gene 1-like protein [Xyrauchen texanus]|uniref:germ cell-specific gene 1-like protein n=1 Tax=Xyrauchen texanus TaxID=154827 RepID=UPI002241AC56|nr:germ cell-specific gene 1-like protein [Xyrauchen texanus]
MGIQHAQRASLALIFNYVAFFMAISAVTTSYWCEGTRKVAKPFCTGPVRVKQSYCIRFNSSNINDTRLVQYIYETGEEKFLMRKFHAGIWFSCEQTVDLRGFSCRKFLEITPDHQRGVLWLCIVAECLYIALLVTGGALMVIEMCSCFNMINRLKLSAFAALCTALSGLFGMIAHMMFTTAFQLAVSMGPEDWRPKTWDYSWSYFLAWGSFGTCMGSAVTALNRYTKTIIKFKFKQRTTEKKMRIKQKMLELDVPEDLWYITSLPEKADQHTVLSVNGIEPSFINSTLLDYEGREYC